MYNGQTTRFLGMIPQLEDPLRTLCLVVSAVRSLELGGLEYNMWLDDKILVPIHCKEQIQRIKLLEVGNFHSGIIHLINL